MRHGSRASATSGIVSGMSSMTGRSRVIGMPPTVHAAFHAVFRGFSPVILNAVAETAMTASV
jgi:hypothetical protein